MRQDLASEDAGLTLPKFERPYGSWLHKPVQPHHPNQPEKQQLPRRRHELGKLRFDRADNVRA